MILSVVVMGIVLYLLLGFFSDKFEYNQSWKFIYLFIIVIISLISYFLISNFSGAFKFHFQATKQESNKNPTNIELNIPSNFLQVL